MRQKKTLAPVYVATGARVRYIREAIGMTQGTLAKRAGLDRTFVARVELGEDRSSFGYNTRASIEGCLGR